MIPKRAEKVNLRGRVRGRLKRRNSTKLPLWRCPCMRRFVRHHVMQP
ncbi:hypothetical protein HMPREF1051_1162 [Neisseria sicca VK64]|uniref:Uncharacterized protein n=1 Tax=Neisseria sicca VK64 TaxID=1095748 RepID=I2NEM5_NEISI|nr:hypothetical protein HMPREF1051_1162 [Neisseria sicca VK64]